MLFNLTFTYAKSIWACYDRTRHWKHTWLEWVSLRATASPLLAECARRRARELQVFQRWWVTRELCQSCSSHSYSQEPRWSTEPRAPAQHRALRTGWPGHGWCRMAWLLLRRNESLKRNKKVHSWDDDTRAGPLASRVLIMPSFTLNSNQSFQMGCFRLNLVCKTGQGMWLVRLVWALNVIVTDADIIFHSFRSRFYEETRY